MTDRRGHINAQLQPLIDVHFGGLEAAAASISASVGRSVCKGTLSKRLSGQQGWPVDEVAALEDACGLHPVTTYLARRLRADEATAAGCLVVAAGAISREAGEAVAATLSAAQSAGGNVAAALAEVDQAVAALEQARAALRALEAGE